jgi:hypothetical protein
MMPKTTDGKIALVALIALAAWLLIGLPLLYLPIEGHVHGEILGVKYGEWLLFAATMGLWWATWRLVRSAEKTAERQLGAYIGIEWCRVATNDGGTTFEVEIQIKNAGQTPAYAVSHRITAALQIMHGERLEFGMPDRSPGIIPIAPGIPFTLRTPIAIGGSSGISTIESGQRRIFTWGRVDYEDVFDNPQHLEFRFSSADAIRKHDGTVMRTVGFRMDAEDDGNTAT